MTIYHVDAYYRKNDVKQYDVMPYNLFGTAKLFLSGFYYPTHRLSHFIKWLNMGRLSEKSAYKLANIMNRNL